MEQETLWILAVVALAIGVLIGFMMGRSGKADDTRSKLLEEDLKKARTEMDSYRKEVTSHFEETAALVNQMTEQYRKVHQHLASGAQALCEGQTPRNLLEDSFRPALTQQEQKQPEKDTGTDTSAKADPAPAATGEESKIAEPPRDYAPKKPNEEGTLSHSYGLKKENADSVQEPPHPDTLVTEEDTGKRH